MVIALLMAELLGIAILSSAVGYGKEDRWLRIMVLIWGKKIFWACFASWWESVDSTDFTCSRVIPPFKPEILLVWSLIPHWV